MAKLSGLGGWVLEKKASWAQARGAPAAVVADDEVAVLLAALVHEVGVLLLAHLRYI